MKKERCLQKFIFDNDQLKSERIPFETISQIVFYVFQSEPFQLITK